MGASSQYSLHVYQSDEALTAWAQESKGTQWLNIVLPGGDTSTITLYMDAARMLALGAAITITATALRNRLVLGAAKQAAEDGLALTRYGAVLIARKDMFNGKTYITLANGVAFTVEQDVAVKLSEPGVFVQVWNKPDMADVARICVDGITVYEAPIEMDTCDKCGDPCPVASLVRVGEGDNIKDLCPNCEELRAQAQQMR